MKIFEKNYDGESIIDIVRDVVEAMDVRFNPIIGDNDLLCGELYA